MASEMDQFLKANDITQTEIAEDLGLDSSSVSRKVGGERQWKLNEIQAVIIFLSRRLGRPVTYEELFGSTVAAAPEAEPVQEPAC